MTQVLELFLSKLTFLDTNHQIVVGWAVAALRQSAVHRHARPGPPAWRRGRPTGPARPPPRRQSCRCLRRGHNPQRAPWRQSPTAGSADVAGRFADAVELHAVVDDDVQQPRRPVVRQRHQAAKFHHQAGVAIDHHHRNIGPRQRDAQADAGGTAHQRHRVDAARGFAQAVPARTGPTWWPRTRPAAPASGGALTSAAMAPPRVQRGLGLSCRLGHGVCLVQFQVFSSKPRGGPPAPPPLFQRCVRGRRLGHTGHNRRRRPPSSGARRWRPAVAASGAPCCVANGSSAGRCFRLRGQLAGQDDQRHARVSAVARSVFKPLYKPWFCTSTTGTAPPMCSPVAVVSAWSSLAAYTCVMPEPAAARRSCSANCTKSGTVTAWVTPACCSAASKALALGPPGGLGTNKLLIVFL